MPYARPLTMHVNGAPVLDSSHFSSAEPSIYGSSTQNDEHDHEQHQALTASWHPTDNGIPWPQNVSTSFAQLALQFQAASHAVASIPPPSSDRQFSSALLDRLDIIEERQKQLGSEIQALQEQFSTLRDNTTEPPVVPKDGNNIAALEASLKEHIETFKLE